MEDVKLTRRAVDKTLRLYRAMRAGDIGVNDLTREADSFCIKLMNPKFSKEVRGLASKAGYGFDVLFCREEISRGWTQTSASLKFLDDGERALEALLDLAEPA